jgi:hypothetical protein
MANKKTLNEDGVELTKADLRERFDKYNELYFEGKLCGCKFFWLSSNHCAYGKYIAQPTKKGLISKIGVARNTIWTEENLRELLVHEMIHMYIRTIECEAYDGVLGHGRRFRAHCKRLRDRFGLNIRIHGDFGFINKKLYPKTWEKVLLWLIDR